MRKAKGQGVVATDKAPKAIGPYSQAISAGKLIFTAGQVALDPVSGQLVGTTAAEQTDQVLKNLQAVLEAAGVSFEHVVKTTVYVATSDRDDLAAAWEVVQRRLGDHEPPSTLVGVTVLGWPGQLVEVEAVAVLEGPDG